MSYCPSPSHSLRLSLSLLVRVIVIVVLVSLLHGVVFTLLHGVFRKEDAESSKFVQEESHKSEASTLQVNCEPRIVSAVLKYMSCHCLRSCALLFGGFLCY